MLVAVNLLQALFAPRAVPSQTEGTAMPIQFTLADTPPDATPAEGTASLAPPAAKTDDDPLSLDEDAPDVPVIDATPMKVPPGDTERRDAGPSDVPQVDAPTGDAVADDAVQSGQNQPHSDAPLQDIRLTQDRPADTPSDDVPQDGATLDTHFALALAMPTEVPQTAPVQPSQRPPSGTEAPPTAANAVSVSAQPPPEARPAPDAAVQQVPPPDAPTPLPDDAPQAAPPPVQPAPSPVSGDGAAPPDTLRRQVESVVHQHLDAHRPDAETDDLGRVQVSLHRDGDEWRVTIRADTPETLDLMRRHADQLQQDLARQGLANTTLDFSDWREGTRPQPEPPLADGDGAAAPVAPSVYQITPRGIAASGLDLRL